MSAPPASTTSTTVHDFGTEKDNLFAVAFASCVSAGSAALDAATELDALDGELDSDAGLVDTSVDGAALDEPLAFEAALAAALVALLAADVPESEPIEHPVSVRAATALDASIAPLIVIRLVVRW